MQVVTQQTVTSKRLQFQADGSLSAHERKQLQSLERASKARSEFQSHYVAHAPKDFENGLTRFGGWIGGVGGGLFGAACGLTGMSESGVRGFGPRLGEGALALTVTGVFAGAGLLAGRGVFSLMNSPTPDIIDERKAAADKVFESSKSFAELDSKLSKMGDPDPQMELRYGATAK